MGTLRIDLCSPPLLLLLLPDLLFGLTGLIPGIVASQVSLFGLHSPLGYAMQSIRGPEREGSV